MKNFMYYIAYVVCFYITRISPNRVKVEGRENIPKDNNFIITANHIGLMDPWIIASFFSFKTPVHWFTIEMLYDLIRVKKYLPKKYSGGVIGFMLARITVFTINRTHTIKVAVQSHGDMSEESILASNSINRLALKKANKILSKKGGIIGIFAQRARNGSIDDTSSSCLLLARKNNVPILPVHVSKGVMIIMKPVKVARNSNSANKKQDRNNLAKELMSKILNQ